MTVRIAAANFEPIDGIIGFEHKGAWTDDDAAMRRDNLAVSLKDPD